MKLATIICQFFDNIIILFQNNEMFIIFIIITRRKYNLLNNAFEFIRF